MKKKIFAIFLSLIIFIGSSIPSFANPLAAGGLIVHLGRIANTLQIGLTAISIVDMGTYLFSRFTIPEQQELIDAYNTDVNEFENLSYEKVKGLGESIGYHYPSDVYVPLRLRKDVSINSKSKPTDFFNIGDSKFGYVWNGSLLGFTRDSLDSVNIIAKNPKSDCVAGNCSLIDDGVLYRSYDVKTGNINLYCKHGTSYRSQGIGVWTSDPSVFTCENCPHSFSNVNKVDYSDLTSEQKDYITQNYPQYDTESVPPTIDESNEEPSKPNFPEFDFGKLDLESLSLSFDNFKNKFPFSIPFDIYNFLNILVVEPKAPIFKVSFLTGTLKLDFSMFDKVSNIIRAFSVFSWVFVLFRFTKKFGE